MKNNETAISLKNISKDFHLPHEKTDSIKSLFTHPFRLRGDATTQRVLKDLSFDVKRGEFFGIVGRNGSGKSTLLKIIAGIYQPTKGSISVNGRLVPFIELGVGFNPELTGRENVFLNGALMGFTDKEVKEKYRDIVEFAELEKFMDQKLKNYSSGMQVRLAFSVATVLAESDILLIDEVLAVGDADFQRKCYEYFKKLKKENKTVIFVSHDMSAVREYCDRAALVDEGKVIAIGKTDKVAQRYTKLFSTDEASVVSKDGSRWGEGKIITSNIEVSISGKLITIKHHVRANSEFDNPVVGIRVRSTSGVEVTGTNTKIENVTTGTFSVGEEKMLIWTFPAILAEGDYYVDPAIHGRDSISVQDWWDEATKFSVTKGRHLPYPIDPGFKIRVE